MAGIPVELEVVVGFLMRQLARRCRDLGFEWVERRLEKALTDAIVRSLAPAPPEGHGRATGLAAAAWIVGSAAQSIGLPPPSVGVQVGAHGASFSFPAGGLLGEALRSGVGTSAATAGSRVVVSTLDTGVTVTDAFGASLLTAAGGPLGQALRSGVGTSAATAGARVVPPAATLPNAVGASLVTNAAETVPPAAILPNAVGASLVTNAAETVSPAATLPNAVGASLLAHAVGTVPPAATLTSAIGTVPPAATSAVGAVLSTAGAGASDETPPSAATLTELVGAALGTAATAASLQTPHPHPTDSLIDSVGAEDLTNALQIVGDTIALVVGEGTTGQKIASADVVNDTSSDSSVLKPVAIIIGTLIILGGAGGAGYYFFGPGGGGGGGGGKQARKPKPKK